MTWLHKFFGQFFIPANSRAKSAQQLISTVLPFHPLYFPWTRLTTKKLDTKSILNCCLWSRMYTSQAFIIAEKTEGAEQYEKLLLKLFNPNVALLLHWLSFPPHPSQMRFCASFHQEYYYIYSTYCGIISYYLQWLKHDISIFSHTCI